MVREFRNISEKFVHSMLLFRKLSYKFEFTVLLGKDSVSNLPFPPRRDKQHSSINLKNLTSHFHSMVITYNNFET